MNKKSVSVIITSKNEEEVVERLFISIKKQSYRDLEVILVDNNSTDNTKEIARKYTNQVYNLGPERSVQRNFGAKKSKGEYLMFLDADMGLSREVISECVELVNKEKNVGGIVIPETSVANNYWGRVKAFEREFYMEGEGEANIEAARFFSKKVFNALGGYDEKITGPEDWDLPEKVKENGFKIGRISARIFHYERVPNPFKLAKKKYYYGLRSHLYMNKHKIPALSSKTIYFLRPVFYKKWRKLVMKPNLAIGMFFMLLLEQVGGGLGYLRGMLKKY